MTVYEYIEERGAVGASYADDRDKMTVLNELARDGWELVSDVETNWSEYGTEWRLMLRRPIPSRRSAQRQAARVS